jgi:hypothetical protein
MDKLFSPFLLTNLQHELAGDDLAGQNNSGVTRLFVCKSINKWVNQPYSQAQFRTPKVLHIFCLLYWQLNIAQFVQ